MKYFMEYYYFYPASISKNTDYYEVINNSQKYYLFEISNEKLINWQYHITSLFPFFNTFVENKFGKIVSNFSKKKYVLLKCNYNNNYNFPFIFIQKMKLKWFSNWVDKSNYLEQYYSSIRGKYPIIDDSFSYYNGLMDMAIYYIKDYDNSEVDGFLQYKKYSSSLFHNPCNTCLDVKERNLGEYLKYIFFNNKYKNVDLEKLINKNRCDYNLVFARVLYPNYYFDLLDEFFSGECDLYLIQKLVSRIDEFEKYLTWLFLEINKVFPIKKISI